MFTPIQNLEKPPLNNQLDTVLYFMQRMDIDMLKTLLSEEYTYQDESKEVFLQMLENAFDRFQNAGDEWPEMYGGCCHNDECNYRCRGYRFNGNNSSHHMDLIIESHEGVLTNIYTCRVFQCTAAPFLSSANFIDLIPPYIVFNPFDGEMPF